MTEKKTSSYELEDIVNEVHTALVRYFTSGVEMNKNKINQLILTDPDGKEWIVSIREE